MQVEWDLQMHSWFMIIEVSAYDFPSYIIRPGYIPISMGLSKMQWMLKNVYN